MTEEAGQVTLIFYKLGERWWKEPFLNIVAAAAQMSSFTHVELAIGSDAGTSGEMTNVARVFNDDVGVELTARTGRNPQYSYLQLGCSKAQELAMLRFAKSCVGKPFSGTAMARSVIWPRRTNGTSFFCAELVAAVLKEGGLLDPVSNPGAATPQGLHELYRGRATTTANPYLLRQANCQRTLTTHSVVQERHYTPPALQQAPVRMARTARRGRKQPCARAIGRGAVRRGGMVGERDRSRERAARAQRGHDAQLDAGAAAARDYAELAQLSVCALTSVKIVSVYTHDSKNTCHRSWRYRCNAGFPPVPNPSVRLAGGLAPASHGRPISRIAPTTHMHAALSRPPHAGGASVFSHHGSSAEPELDIGRA